jgi:hypothetical protein
MICLLVASVILITLVLIVPDKYTPVILLLPLLLFVVGGIFGGYVEWSIFIIGFGMIFFVIGSIRFIKNLSIMMNRRNDK